MLSVIIPTYNRAEDLKICLEKLNRQKGVEFEIIVVDDGSRDHTLFVVEDLLSKIKNLRGFTQENSGQATARNKGVEKAIGEIILFIGDDIWVEPDFLKKHLEAHQKHGEENVVVLGFSTWSPGLEWEADGKRMVEVNDYMKFLETSGWQFGYGFLKPGFVDHPQPYKFFYTSNISMKKSFFEKEKFDESFTSYGWEDAELGYRLWKNHAMKLFYEPEGKAYHHHFISESELPKKMQAVGRSAVHFQRLHPEVKAVPQGFKKWFIKIATNPITLPLTRLLGKNNYFKFKSWREFWRGVGRVK